MSLYCEEALNLSLFLFCHCHHLLQFPLELLYYSVQVVKKKKRASYCSQLLNTSPFSSAFHSVLTLL